MDLVIDANILFAMIIRKGITERILFSDSLHIYAPEYIFLEFKERKEYLLSITSRPEDEFIKLIEILERRIELIPTSEFKQFIKEAETLISDKDDAVYLAVCLAKKMPLWTNDNHFSHQNKIKIFTTQELIRYLEIE
ncbi:MAG: PIN domain-containing protein [Candidatus Micrarchaeota archaeon]|nr:PIN domain-containing protein [Candidatus Micrarchaeota archaeon]